MYNYMDCCLGQQEQAKIHFGCDDILGVELENQGGSGTALAHWEHRVVGVWLYFRSSYSNYIS